MTRFNRFKEAFHCTEDRRCGDLSLIDGPGAEKVLEIVSELGGQSFEHGLYRVLRADEVHKATQAARLAYPELSERILAFGYDWLGRLFAADSGRLAEGAPQVLLLEVGAGEAMQIPVDPIAFHENELVDHSADALAEPFFRQWQAATHSTVYHDQCVGYKLPLFLGGADTVDNLEAIDLSVYWHICSQLRAKAVTLREGQTITEVYMGGWPGQSRQG